MYLRGVNIYNQMFSNYNSNPHQEMWNICGNEVCAGLFWNLIEGGDYRSRVLGNLVGYARQAMVVRGGSSESLCLAFARLKSNWRYRYWRWPTPNYYHCVSIHLKNKVDRKQRFHRCHNCIFSSVQHCP